MIKYEEMKKIHDDAVTALSHIVPAAKRLALLDIISKTAAHSDVVWPEKEMLLAAAKDADAGVFDCMMKLSRAVDNLQDAMLREPVMLAESCDSCVLIQGQWKPDDGFCCRVGVWEHEWHKHLHIPRCPDCHGELVADNPDNPSSLVCCGRRTFTGCLNSSRGCGSQFVVGAVDGDVWMRRLVRRVEGDVANER